MQAHFSILLIEHIGIDSLVKKTIISPESYTITQLSDSTKAWNFLLSNQYTDLIIVNINLPNKKGFQVSFEDILGKIKTHPNWKDIPTLIIAHQDTDKSYLENKIIPYANRILLEPYNPLRFLDEIHQLTADSVERHINSLNTQHTQLGVQFNKILDLLSKAPQDQTIIRAKFHYLAHVINEHFLFEETYMDAHHYPDYQQHRGEHNILRDELAKLTEGKTPINLSSIKKLFSQVFGDINNDAVYIEFIEKLKDNLTARSR